LISVVGVPVLTGTGTVLIFVEDINDHSPEFSQSQYRSDVVENGPIGLSVTKVSAFDNDSGENALIR
jgi:hypothetical protein